MMTMVMTTMTMCRRSGNSSIGFQAPIDVYLLRGCRSRVAGAGHPGRNFELVRLLDMC